MININVVELPEHLNTTLGNFIYIYIYVSRQLLECMSVYLNVDMT